MSAARDLLRRLWALGVRVHPAGDRFRLTPAGATPAELRELLKTHRADVAALLAQLPAPGRCQICGDPTGWNDGRLLANCTNCALAAFERAFSGVDLDPQSPAQQRATYPKGAETA
jgi:hypothetical protein